VEDSSYDHSALGNFKDWLGENRWKKLFFVILKQIEDAGFAVNGGVKIPIYGGLKFPTHT